MTTEKRKKTENMNSYSGIWRHFSSYIYNFIFTLCSFVTFFIFRLLSLRLSSALALIFFFCHFSFFFFQYYGRRARLACSTIR